VDLAVGGSLMVFEQNLHGRELHPGRGGNVRLVWQKRDEYEVASS
jgi:hypothetical protein